MYFKIQVFLFSILLILGACTKEKAAPNFIIVFTDDQRFDALGTLPNPDILTPLLDSLSKTGVNFKNAFVTLSICSPSRAALLTGRYGLANGVVTYGNVNYDQDEKTFANYFKQNGYETGLVGKWHLRNSPESAGFDYASYFFSNGPWYDRRVIEQGDTTKAKGFIEDYNARKVVQFLEQRQEDKPFLLFLNPQLPHLDHKHEWDVQEETVAKYSGMDINPPENWKDDLSGKPPYLQSGRHRQLAMKYGYQNRDTLISKIKRYYSAITEMDASLGRVFRYVRQNSLDENTYILVMGDNGWFIGDHLFTSKVLAYEESIRVPFFVTGPGIVPGENHELVLNIDLMPTLLELADIEIPDNLHGESMVPLLKNQEEPDWRDRFYYEAPEPQLGSWPLYAVRSKRYKYIRTYDINNRDSVVFEELYDLENDPYELTNRIDDPGLREKAEELSGDVDSLRNRFVDE
ncbi:sulfatase-like hydrolase/transferase [Halalkalibaculum sp. DA3122]|uniref:sulfatase-like hydrolase/transferase n=1 Tax=Halalkalibaculum sp. DA3122 TaxID=3373607 RepID=UPI003754AD76